MLGLAWDAGCRFACLQQDQYYHQHKPAWTNIKFWIFHVCEQGKQKRAESYPVCEIIALVFFWITSTIMVPSWAQASIPI